MIRLNSTGMDMAKEGATLGVALLVLLGDYTGQFLLFARHPVGIVTGVRGAPYLLYLSVRDNKTRGTL